MSVRARVQSVAEDHRVTTFELFFDLVFVFAVTQLTAYMADAHTAEGVIQATLLAALFWWSWSAYAWLANRSGPSRASSTIEKSQLEDQSPPGSVPCTARVRRAMFYVRRVAPMLEVVGTRL